MNVSRSSRGRLAHLTAACFALLAQSLGVDAAMGAEEQPPYSWRGTAGQGVFPAKGLVTEFWSLAPDLVTSAKDRSSRERKLDLPGKPGEEKNIVWRTDCPLSDRTSRDFSHREKKAPCGYQGHMGPGGTPVVMRLGDTTVAVRGNGLVVRVSDGKLLGQVKLPKGTPIRKGKVLDRTHGLLKLSLNAEANRDVPWSVTFGRR